MASSFHCSQSIDSIKTMDIMQLYGILDENNINYDELETEEEMRDLIIKNMEMKENIQTDKVNSIIVMEKILDKDAHIKKELEDIYKKLQELLNLRNFDENLKNEVELEFGDFQDQLKEYANNLRADECPIVVAGETGAGKSSLLNLLLGSEVLPHSVLSTTSTLCQLRNSNHPRAEVFTKNGPTLLIEFEMNNFENQREVLRKYVTDRSSDEYKCVDIYWPLPMLKHNTMIVDTPGIGESDDMTDKLLQYLPKAVAFIYVINSANAGGVQSDRLLKIFKRQKEWEQKGMMQEFDPNCTIFVCNKWDQVPHEEDDKLWEETVQKLKTSWPVKHETNIENQMFKMCTVEEQRRASTGLDYTDKFKRLLNGIEKLIPASLEAKVKRHANWLEMFLSRLQHRLIARINATKRNRDEKLKMKEDIQARIAQLRNNTDEVKTTLLTEAEKRCEDIAQQLHRHLNKEDTKTRMFNWNAEEIPDGNDLEVIKYKCHKEASDKIHAEIISWCHSESIAHVTSELLTMFKTECRLLEGGCQDLDRLVEGVMSPFVGYLNTSENSSDFEVSPSGLFPMQEKLALVVFAPLWLPLVISASVIAFPVVLGVLIKDTLDERKTMKKFRDNKVEHMKEWSAQILQNYTVDSIFQVLRSDYLKSFNEHVEYLCETFIPKQIQADEQLIDHIIKDMRDSDAIKKQYQPLLKRCKEITGELLVIMMENFEGYSIPWENIKVGHPLGRGQYSEVKEITFTSGSGEVVDGAIKQLHNALMRSDCYDQMTEVKYLRRLDHHNIVKFYGVSFQKVRNRQIYLSILMEKCEETLENLLICRTNKPYPCDCHVNREPPCCIFKERSVPEFLKAWAFYHSMAVGISDGLDFVHRMGLVHRDLKLTNILVKNQTARLADVGFTKHVDFLTGSVVGTPTNMAPEVLKGDLYGAAADIYSLSIVFWEMWYAKKVFSEDYNNEVVQSFASLQEHVIGDHRPDFMSRYAPPRTLQKLIERCWDGDSSSRPTANDVCRLLSIINENIHI